MVSVTFGTPNIIKLVFCQTSRLLRLPKSQYFDGSGQRKRTFWVDCNEIHISNLDVNQRLPRHPYEGIGSLGSLGSLGNLGVSGVSESRESRESRSLKL